MVIRLRVEGRPPALNKLLGHWGQAYRLKKAWTDQVMVSKQNQRLRKAKGKRRVDMHVCLGRGTRQTDPDALWKASLDALKVNGLLVDDSPKWCEMGTVTQERAPTIAGWTTYVLTEIQ
jgi:hypothetical protein